MSTIVTRAGKGSPLTNTEVDTNFTNLNTDKYQSGDNASFGSLAYNTTLTGGTGIVNFGSGQFYKDASGNVGIGTASTPTGSSAGSRFITVAGSGDGVLQLTRTGATAGGAAIAAASGPGMLFYTHTGTVGSETYTERMRINSSGNVGIGTASPAVKLEISSTDAIMIPKGTTGQQPTGVAGYLRFNTTTTQFEGHNGTTWSSVGGAAITNDTATASFVYPLFGAATSGSATTVYTSNAKLLYKPSTGEFQASELAANNGIILNATTVAASYTIGTGYNAMSVGPVTVASGQSVTVSSGQRWLVF